MANTGADAIVIGAGLVGLLTAAQLAQRGLSVIVLERDRPGAHASGLNAGGVRTVGRHPAELALAHAAWQLWREAERTIGPGARMLPVGHLLLAETEDERRVLDGHEQSLRAAGLAIVQRLGEDDIVRLVPALRPVPGTAALHAPLDGMADPASVVEAALARARQLGVDVRSGVGVRAMRSTSEGLVVDTGRAALSAQRVVNAAGAFGGTVAALVGDELPVRIEAPMAQRSAPAPRVLGPVVQTIGRKLTLKQLPSGHMLVGGGHRGRVDLAVPAGVPIATEADANRATAIDLFPALAGVGIDASWAGLEGYTPDRLPIIGPSAADPRVVHAVAFCGHGFQLAPAVAPLVAHLVLRQDPPTDIHAFRPGRFATAEIRDSELRAG